MGTGPNPADGLEMQGKKITRKPIKMGDSVELPRLHENEDRDWDESDEEWPNTVNREERNRMRRRRERMRREEKQDRETFKAQCMIGVGLITKESEGFFDKIVGDFSEAKTMAAK